MRNNYQNVKMHKSQIRYHNSRSIV